MNNATTTPKTIKTDCWIVSGFAAWNGPEIYPAQREGTVNRNGHQIVLYRMADRPSLHKAASDSAFLFGYNKIDRTNLLPRDIFNTAAEAMKELRRRLDLKTRNMAKMVAEIELGLTSKGLL